MIPRGSNWKQQLNKKLTKLVDLCDKNIHKEQHLDWALSNKKRVIRFPHLLRVERDEENRNKNCMAANIEHFYAPPSSFVKHYNVSNFMHGWKDSGRILDYSRSMVAQFDFLNYSNKIMPHDRTTNLKEIMEHCVIRLVKIKISLYVRRR